MSLINLFTAVAPTPVSARTVTFDKPLRARKPPKPVDQAAQRAYRQKHYQEIRDIALLAQREYRRANKDLLIAQRKVYYDKNKARIKATQAAYREKNRESILAKSRAKRLHKEIHGES